MAAALFDLLHMLHINHFTAASCRTSTYFLSYLIEKDIVAGVEKNLLSSRDILLVESIRIEQIIKEHNERMLKQA